MKVMPAVKALIERDGDILVLRTETANSSYWVLPGGRIDYGEEPVQALEREITEEISCNSEIGNLIGMYYFFMGEKDEGKQVALIVFKADIDGEVDISDNPADENITEYRWMKPKELIEKSDNDSLKELISNHFGLAKE